MFKIAVVILAVSLAGTLIMKGLEHLIGLDVLWMTCAGITGIVGLYITIMNLLKRKR